MNIIDHPSLTAEDYQLIAEATQKIKSHFTPKKHRLASLIKTQSGKVFIDLNVEGPFGCVDICAEQVVLGEALSQGNQDIETVVTVRHPRPEETDQEIKVASPCGKCRELLAYYAPEAWVVVRSETDLYKVKAKELLPFKYSKM